MGGRLLLEGGGQRVQAKAQNSAHGLSLSPVLLLPPTPWGLPWAPGKGRGLQEAWVGPAGGGKADGKVGRGGEGSSGPGGGLPPTVPATAGLPLPLCCRCEGTGKGPLAGRLQWGVVLRGQSQ